MNYRHAFHAGNLADVVKHAALAFTLAYMTEKPGPIRVIDSHAGVGLYDLLAEEATRTGEWVDGIGKLWGRPVPEAAEPFLGPYLDAVARLNPDGRLRLYPGSPEIARLGARETDRLIFCEKHPEDAAALAAIYARLKRAKTLAMDGWLSPRAHLPAPEKRALLLVDPPFEEAGDYERLIGAARDALSRMAGVVILLWHPIKADGRAEAFQSAFAALAAPKKLALELRLDRPAGGLLGAGVALINAPYTLAGAAEAAAAHFAEVFGARGGRLLVKTFEM